MILDGEAMKVPKPEFVAEGDNGSWLLGKRDHSAWHCAPLLHRAVSHPLDLRAGSDSIDRLFGRGGCKLMCAGSMAHSRFSSQWSSRAPVGMDCALRYSSAVRQAVVVGNRGAGR